MPDNDNQDIENLGKDLANAFREIVAWEWDSRFGTILANFDVENEGAIQEILAHHVGIAWNPSNVSEAPHIVQRVLGMFGGLMPEQQLFTTDTTKEVILFCAWWPWGNGDTISIRIAPFFNNLPDSEKEERVQLFKSWFDV
jgi:hypothetical protein